ncbi:hypothetical protein AB0163_27520, partial [Klebsiella pneumoniae]
LASMFATYGWPGNARELRNVIERYAHLGARDAAGLFDGTGDAANASATLPHEDDWSHLPLHEARRLALDAFERAYVPRVLERAGGVVSKAAQLA